MPSYIYKARDEQGKPASGEMEAVSPEEASGKLRAMGYMATSITLAKPGINLKDIAAKYRPIKAQDLVVFYFQLANLIESGIPILSALRTIETQIENKKLKEIASEVQRDIEAGAYFSAGLNKHRRVFSRLFVNMVKAGEESGRLDKVLRRYALFSEAQAELREKVKGALFYPAILLAASLAVILFIVTFIIPQFVNLFTRAGVRLPFVTQALFIAGVCIKKYWLFALLGTAALIFALKQYRFSKNGGFRIDRLILKIPITGVLARKIYISRFSRTLATLTSSGVPILQSLDITREVIGNAVIAEVILRARQAVEQGQKLSEPLKLSREIPADAVQMIAVAEETGNLDEMLNKIADFYDMAAGYSIKKLTTVIEPLFLAVMGSVVAFIMASMLIPIFDMAKMLRR